MSGDCQVTDMSRLVMAVYEAGWVGVRMSKQVMSRMGMLQSTSHGSTSVICNYLNSPYLTSWFDCIQRPHAGHKTNATCMMHAKKSNSLCHQPLFCFQFTCQSRIDSWVQVYLSLRTVASIAPSEPQLSCTGVLHHRRSRIRIRGQDEQLSFPQDEGVSRMWRFSVRIQVMMGKLSLFFLD